MAKETMHVSVFMQHYYDLYYGPYGKKGEATYNAVEEMHIEEYGYKKFSSFGSFRATKSNYENPKKKKSYR